MSTRCFRWTTFFLIVVANLQLGVVSFLLWNQQVENKYSSSDTGANQAGTGGPDQAETRHSGEEESENKPSSQPAEGGKTYQVDTVASRIYVKVGSATRLGHPHGVEGKLKSGKVSLGGGGELVFAMNSFKADTKDARSKVGLAGKNISDNEAKKVNQAMLSTDVLDVEKFPTATYKITAIKAAEKRAVGAPGTYQVEGRFTLHGTEKPLRFKAKLERTDKEGVVKLSGSFAIKQTDYGIQPYSVAGGLVKVADEIEISGDLILEPASRAAPSAGEKESQKNPIAKDGELSSGEKESQKQPKTKGDEASSREEGIRKQRKSERAEGAPTYQVDTAASRIYVKVGSATRSGHPHGVEGNLKSGTIILGAGGELVFDLSSFKADTKAARSKVGLEGKTIRENEAKKVNETMRGAHVLDLEKFPTATYKIIAIKPAERQDAGALGMYEVNGRLILHGAEQPLLFRAKLERTDKQGTVKLSGSFAIKQTDYGITPYSSAGGQARMADELEIHGELLLTPAK